MVSPSQDFEASKVCRQGTSVLVTGATGFIGRALVLHLGRLGYSIRVLSRRNGGIFAPGVVVVQGDLTEPSSLPASIFSGIDGIFNCAGELGNPGTMRRLHVEGTANLLNLLGSRGRGSEPLRWVQLSSVGAYGPGEIGGMTRVVTECTPEDPRGEYEITKTEADHLLQNASREGHISLTILRPSNVFGPGMPNRSLPGLLNAIRRGLFFYIGSRDATSTYVHVDDVARALVACASNPNAVGKVYNLSNDCHLADLVNAVADAYGRSRPHLVVPESLMRLLTHVFEGRSFWPLTSSRIDALVSRTRYPADLIRRELGFEFSRPVPVSALELLD
jgi:nucleoside-diphosphate-sugar epimerase